MSALLAAQSLPSHEARHRALCDRVIALQSTGYGLPRLARDIGHHHDRLAAWLKDPAALPDFSVRVGEPAVRDQLADALQSRLEALDAARPAFTEPASVETTVTRAVIDGIATARDLRRTVLVDAPAGAGKSDGIAQYLAQRRRTEGYGAPVWVVALTEYNLAPARVLAMVGEQCGIVTHDGKVTAEHIADATAGRGGVLVLDEANHLGDAQRIQGLAILNGLRSFVDRGLFGLAIVGNGEVYRRLAAGKHAQLLSRMAPGRVEVAALGKGRPGQAALQAADVEAVMSAWGVAGVKERELCLRLAAEPGALRNLVDAFKLCLYRFGVVDALSLRALVA